MLTIQKNESRAIRNESDIVAVRQVVKNYAILIKLSLVEQTKIITAASEIARNTLIYGGGGKFTLEWVEDSVYQRQGLRLMFEDQGSGIADISHALQDGFTSGKGMGLGLGGAKRLVDEFNITSQISQGTCVVMIKWK